MSVEEKEPMKDESLNKEVITDVWAANFQVEFAKIQSMVE